MKAKIAALMALSFCSELLTPNPKLSQAAEGAPTLSLPQLLAELQRANPDLAAARKRWEAAQAKIPLAKGLPAPRIGVEWEEIPRGTVKLNQATLMYQFIQSLPFPGKLPLRHQVAVKEAQVAAMEFKKTEWETTSMLKRVYYDLFLLERELELQQEISAWLDQAAAVAQVRYATGSAPEAELLRIQMEALESSNEVMVLEHRRRAMAAHLNHLLGRPADHSVGRTDQVALIPVPDTPEGLWLKAQENQPELLAFKFSAERAEAAWKLSKRELLPDLETMLELRDPAMGPIGPWDLSLGIVLPFWFWTKQKYGVKAALINKESVEAAYQGMQNEIQRRIHEFWHEAKADYGTVKLCEEGLIPLAKQSLASALSAYQGGRGSYQELLEGLEALTERRRTYYRHLVDLEQRMVMLEEAVGAPLREPHQPQGRDEASLRGSVATEAISDGKARLLRRPPLADSSQ